MTLMTLVPETLAKIGYEFYMVGPLPECKSCRLRSVCFQLEQGKVYKVTKVRENKHPCKIHGRDVCIVEVEPSSFKTSVHEKRAVEGSMLEYVQVVCASPGCEHYHTCKPMFAKEGRKYKIKKVGKKLECLEGHDLKEVELE